MGLVKNQPPVYINRIFSYFSNSFLFYMLDICELFGQNKVLVLLKVILYKKLCKNVLLRGHIFFFVQIILQLAVTFIPYLK